MLAATGMVLGACYLLWMVRKVLFGPLKEPVPHAAARPRVGDRGQHRQQPRRLPVQGLRSGEQLANRRVNQ